MQTHVDLSSSDKCALIAWHARDWLGRTLGRRPKTTQALRRAHERLSDGRLTPAQVDALVQFQTTKVGADYRSRRTISEMQTRAVDLLSRTLTDRRHICSVANVGARVDHVSAVTAPKFPHIEFVSIDLQPDLAQHNSHLPPAPNWRFLSGYALPLFEQRQVHADLVIMTSTATLFTPRELAEYLAAFRQSGTQTIVLNEPWWWNGYAVGRPECIRQSKPAGAHGNYHHNYASALSAAGYDVALSRLERVATDPFCCLQIVADLR